MEIKRTIRRHKPKEDHVNFNAPVLVSLWHF